MAERLDLVYRVLDLQIVDVNERRCGKVDDVELSGDPLRATALLVGSGAYPERVVAGLPHRLLRRLVGPEVLGGNLVRVPWEEVEEIGPRVKLRRPAGDLGLGRADDELSPVMGRLMFSSGPEE